MAGRFDKLPVLTIRHFILVDVEGVQVHLVTRTLIDASVPCPCRHPHRERTCGNQHHRRPILPDNLLLERHLLNRPGLRALTRAHSPTWPSRPPIAYALVPWNPLSSVTGICCPYSGKRPLTAIHPSHTSKLNFPSLSPASCLLPPASSSCLLLNSTLKTHDSKLVAYCLARILSQPHHRFDGSSFPLSPSDPHAKMATTMR